MHFTGFSIGAADKERTAPQAPVLRRLLDKARVQARLTASGTGFRNRHRSEIADDAAYLHIQRNTTSFDAGRNREHDLVETGAASRAASVLHRGFHASYPDLNVKVL